MKTHCMYKLKNEGVLRRANENTGVCKVIIRRRKEHLMRHNRWIEGKTDGKAGQTKKLTEQDTLGTLTKIHPPCLRQRKKERLDPLFMSVCRETFVSTHSKKQLFLLFYQLLNAFMFVLTKFSSEFLTSLVLDIDSGLGESEKW